MATCTAVFMRTEVSHGNVTHPSSGGEDYRGLMMPVQPHIMCVRYELITSYHVVLNIVLFFTMCIQCVGSASVHCMCIETNYPMGTPHAHRVVVRKNTTEDTCNNIDREDRKLGT